MSDRSAPPVGTVERREHRNTPPAYFPKVFYFAGRPTEAGKPMFAAECGPPLPFKVRATAGILWRPAPLVHALPPWQHISMGDLTAEAFADWLDPSDVIDNYISLGQREAKERVIAMLCDGLLQAAAAQLIVDGTDLGLALIDRGLWSVIRDSDVWSTGRFRLASSSLGSERQGVSAYGVKIDREIRTLPALEKRAVAASEPEGKQALSNKRLSAWGKLFLAAHPHATESNARASLDELFPNNSVSRERLRAVLPARKRGRPLKKQD